jgi:hypothetical protein
MMDNLFKTSGQMSVLNSSGPFRIHLSAVSMAQQLVVVPRVVFSGQVEGESLEYAPSNPEGDEQSQAGRPL